MPTTTPLASTAPAELLATALADYVITQRPDAMSAPARDAAAHQAVWLADRGYEIHTVEAVRALIALAALGVEAEATRLAAADGLVYDQLPEEQQLAYRTRVVDGPVPQLDLAGVPV